MSIQDLIATVGSRLTPTERRLARLVSDDPTLLAFGTVSDLAARADTSHPSVVRFAAKLGFVVTTSEEDTSIRHIVLHL